MNPAAFDTLSRRLARSVSRRSLLAGMVAIAPYLGSATARKRRKKKTKCVKLGDACGGKRKCCNGDCQKHVCNCRIGQKQCGNRCISSSGCCAVGDCAESQTPCRERACESNNCTEAKLPVGTPCGDGLLACDAQGNCVTGRCKTASDCPGVDKPCQFRACNDGQCAYVSAGAGAVVSTEPNGDCLRIVCDGHGNERPVPDESDVPAGNACGDASCDSGEVHWDYKTAGTPCGSGNRICDGAGHCV